MYVTAFLLYFLERGSIVTEASPPHHPPTKNHFEEMWLKNGRGWVEPADQQYQSPRRKRSDEVVPQDTEWKPDDYYGLRSAAVVSIENDGRYDNYDRRLAYGVRLQSKMVLTLCSAVTFVTPYEYRIDYWDHTDKRYPVTKCRPQDMSVHVMTTKDYKKAEVKEYVLRAEGICNKNISLSFCSDDMFGDHFFGPRCDNQYDVDLAVLVTDPIPDSKNVWIHTAENLLFRRNLDRVVAAQAVLGKCSVPVYSKTFDPNDREKIIYGVDHVRVNYQNWDGCKETLCPYWDPHPGQRKHQDPRRCGNLRNGTRYCMAWTIPEKGLCDLLPGTPVFCDVGQIHGLMGFLPRETYECWPFVNKNAVMQGLTDGIAWIRRTLLVQKAESYEQSIPAWMKNFRDQFVENITPRVRPRHKKKPSPDVTYNNFVGQQFLSVVNVYMFGGNLFKCRGTLVSPKIVVLPCSCVSYNKLNMSLDENIDTPHPALSYDLRKSHFKVSLMTNGTYPYSLIVYAEKHVYCDNHYNDDSAWIELDEPLPLFKLAWLMSNDKDEFKRMLMITAVSDSAMGHDCYYLEDVTYRHGVPLKNKIRFVPWTRCIHNVCPTDRWKTHQQSRCFGDQSRAADLTTYCIESDDKEAPACEITHGTPIFCNLEQARGLVGFVTTAMDLNPTNCFERSVVNQTAVLQAIDELLPQFKIYTWIDEFIEEYGKESARSFSPSVMPWGILTTLLLTTIVVIINV